MLGIGRAGPLGPRRVAASDEAASGPASVLSARAGPAETDREAWAIVAAANEVGPATMERLLSAFGSPRAILDVARSRRARATLRGVLSDDRGGKAVAGLIGAAETATATVADLRRSGVTLVTLEDDAYPPALRVVDLPPPVLFVRGSVAALSADRSIAIVGTRRPTEHGRRIAGQIASAVTGCGGTVVSGLAVGIDGAAHAAAVEAGGPTVAVLGGGHDRLFPTAHRRLAEEIVAHGGAVVSEFLPTVEPAPWSFPRRNRVISGLASATIVVEAGRRSGALITARSALAQGRACFVVPGPIDAPTSAGCLAFLREYTGVAQIVAGVPQLLVDLGLVGDQQRPLLLDGSPDAALAGAGSVERQVGALVAAGVGGVDALVDATELPVATVLAAITLLETRGLVVDALGVYRPAGALHGPAGPEPARPQRAQRRR
jgi:DNA processing protein